MCRLFGMIAPEPASARFWLLNAPDSVVDQSHRNADGTGLAYYDEDHQAKVEKQPIAAHKDQEFASGARQVRSHLFVAHVRHATQGRVSQENTQPFVHQGLVFAHNGNIEGLEDLPFAVGPLYGDTDSKRYFALLRHHVREGPEPLAGVRRTVDWISENRDYTSLNFLLADGERLYALRSVGNEDLWVRRLEAGEDLLGSSSYAPARKPVSTTAPCSSPPKSWTTLLRGRSWSLAP
jgi:predicted glutamine amidotransferase